MPHRVKMRLPFKSIVLSLRAQLWSLLIPSIMSNDQIAAPPFSQNVVIKNEDEFLVFHQNLPNKPQIFCIRESHLLLCSSAECQIEMSSNKSLRSLCEHEPRDLVGSVDLSPFSHKKCNNYRKIDTYEMHSGCSDLALFSAAKSLFCSKQLSSANDIFGVLMSNNKALFKKRCIVWLESANLVNSSEYFSSFIEAISQYYEVTFLPPSNDIRSDVFSEYVMAMSHLSGEYVLPTGPPSLFNLISLSNSELDQSMLISDMPEIGWIFSALGMNSVYVSNGHHGLSRILSNGYCQLLNVTDIEAASDSDYCELIGKIEANQCKFAQNRICRIHSKNILCELAICYGGPPE